MREANIVIVDEDADFCRRLDGSLRARLSFPVAVHDFTDPAALRTHARREETTALLISERALTKTGIEGFPRVIVLSEGLGIEAEAPVLRRVNKYRALNGLIREITEMALDVASADGAPLAEREGRATLIGFFTPLSRCLQTTSALTMGQLCAQRKRTLYLNLEPFAGLPALAGEDGGLTELLYYCDCEPQKMALHVERIKREIGALCAIPPAETCTDLTETEVEKWRSFLTRLAEETEYEVVVADLSVCVRGLPDLLREFDHIVTIGRTDAVSEEKLKCFDRMLKRGGHEELIGRSLRTPLPFFDRLPADPARYGEGALADFWRRALEEKGWLCDDDA